MPGEIILGYKMKNIPWPWAHYILMTLSVSSGNGTTNHTLRHNIGLCSLSNTASWNENVFFTPQKLKTSRFITTVTWSNQRRQNTHKQKKRGRMNAPQNTQQFLKTAAIKYQNIPYHCSCVLWSLHQRLWRRPRALDSYKNLEKPGESQLF